MRITKFLAVAAVLTARTCLAGIFIESSSPDEETLDLVKDLVKIVTSCYEGPIKAVGLAGNLPDSLIRTLSVEHSVPTVLTDDTSVTSLAPEVDIASTRFRYKLHVFVIGVSSLNELWDTLQCIIKPSIWWNQMASFIILDQSRECRNNANYLYAAWQLDLINAKVMCYYRSRNGRYLVNYNPFINEAPASWGLFNFFPAINNHPFSLFSRAYLGDDSICVDLDFVKTRNLGRYAIRVGNPVKVFDSEIKMYPRTKMQMTDLEIRILTALGALNATPKLTDLTVHNSSERMDMTLQLTLMVDTGPGTYPYEQSGIVIVSHYRGHKTQLEKILSITDIDSRIGMGIVYLITLIFFKFFVHQALVPAILNLVRITCNTGLTNLPDNTASRLYLTGLLFFVVTMQGIYQGNLASLLTNEVPYPNIDSLDDLVDGDYKIYSLSGEYEIMKSSGLEKRYIMVNDTGDCMMHVVNSSSAVCIHFPEGITLDIAREYDLHLSNKFIATIPLGFLIRTSWCLEDQLNIILGRMMEASIFETWESKCDPVQLKDFLYDKEVLKNADYRVIELKDVLFAFVILGIGLTCATVVFIVEVAIY